MSWTAPSGFYVYQYNDKTGNPVYIGKGCGRRAVQLHAYVNIESHDQIVILKDKLTEQEAWDLEVQLIADIGRECNGTGPLKNLSPGGPTQRSGWNHSPETRKQISKALLGVKKADTSNYCKPKLEKHKENIRKARTGTKHTEERKQKIKRSMKEKRWFRNDERSIFCNEKDRPDGFWPGRIMRRV